MPFSKRLVDPGQFSQAQMQWFVRLRWCACVAQAVIALISQYAASITAPWIYIWAVVGITGVSNVLLHRYAALGKATHIRSIGLILTFDTMLLTVLLGASGGPANPFSLIYLAHVSIAAFLLGSKWAWLMVGFCSFCFTLLFRFHIPVPELSMHHHDGSGAFAFHLLGMLLAFITVSTILGFFLSKMSQILEQQRKEIVSLMQIASDQERLASLTTLAAGAAHELGSPLGTIAIAAGELKREVAQLKNTSLLEDAQLIIEQVKRCREIIDSLSDRSGEVRGEAIATCQLSSISDFLSEQVLGAGWDTVTVHPFGPVEVLVPKRTLVSSLFTLVKNGVEAYEDRNGEVHVRCESSLDRVSFVIADTGQGISEENLSRLGEPFFTTKDPGKGMGLGIFLVKLFARRLGGSLTISSKENKGTTVTLEIPRCPV